MRNQSVELLKFISMIFIVSLHIRFSSNFGYALYAIARFAVPVFFMVMGYYVVKPKTDLNKVKSQIIKFIKYYIMYESIYILISFLIACLNNNLTTFSAELLVNFKFFLISPVIGIQLWYIINTVWTLIVVYIFARFNRINLLFYISILLHITAILFFHMSGIKLGLRISRNFLFFGLFYTMLGAFFTKVKIHRIKLNKHLILFFSLLMIMLQVKERIFWEQYFDSQFNEYYFTTILASCSIFIFTLKSTINNKLVLKFVLRLSKYTMPIYFLHVIVFEVLTFISSHFWIDISTIRGSIFGNLFFIVIVCIISCIVYSLIKGLNNVISHNSTKVE